MFDVARQADLCADDFLMLNLTNNAVFALPQAGLVVRIPRSFGLDERVLKVFEIAQWFEQIDAPTIRLARHEMIETHGLHVTLWTYLPHTDGRPTTSHLGEVLREIHALPLPPFRLPEWNPVADARARIVDAEGLSKGDHAFLLDWCEELEPAIVELRSHGNHGLIHGDAHAGNLLFDCHGRTVMCDFDAVCAGPRGVDLASVAVGDTRFRNTDKYESLKRAYGKDVKLLDEWPTLRQARELKMIVAVVPYLNSGNGVQAEFNLRLDSIRQNKLDVPWTPFAQLALRSSR
ncbi:MAG: aminoglycoside phosphotransferase family protein [Corynebacteriales bacterium]|nr:aminoglycoside phosphotransferase family protein [Mycobacteriales bacterium]